MNHLSKLIICLMLCSYAAVSQAQTNGTAKPALFANFPSTIQVSGQLLKNVLLNNKDQYVNIQLGSGLSFSGTVMSNVQKYENLRIIIIRSDVWANTLLQLSQVTNENGSFSFNGKIINPDAADGYEIKQTADGTYTLRKFETDRIFQTCFN